MTVDFALKYGAGYSNIEDYYGILRAPSIAVRKNLSLADNTSGWWVS